MLDLPIGRLFWTFQRLAAFSQTLTTLWTQGLREVVLSAYDYDEVLRNADEFSSLCPAATLNVTYEASKLVCSDLHLATKIGDLHRFDYGPFIRAETSFKQLTGCLRSEAFTKVAMILPPELVGFYDPKTPLFGADVDSFFPNASRDIDEGAKCLALGRSTACVFHSMRVLEVGLNAIHAFLQLARSTNQNWGTILDTIKRRIQSLGKSHADHNFLEEIHGRLDIVRRAWRNATMHVETVYTEEDAKVIFEATKALMRKIASRIDERGQDVTWLSASP
jgi:hypothetical protein